MSTKKSVKALQLARAAFVRVVAYEDKDCRHEDDCSCDECKVLRFFDTLVLNNPTPPPEPRYTLDQIQEAFSQALYASDAKTTTYDLRDAVLAKLVKP